MSNMRRKLTILASLILLLCLATVGLRAEDSSQVKKGTPEETYYKFVEFLEQGDISDARALTNGNVRIVSEEPLEDTIPYINVKFFQARKSESAIVFKQIRENKQVSFRSGIGYFVLQKEKGKWVIAKAGLKPID